ncbi:MAG: acyloxyacyl hydrolase [Gemmatimonadales bacterium]|nr:acyloxyacyl hydrolase [Gemmatimonadales bacterium]
MAAIAAPMAAQSFPPGDRWYQNPLGFSPLQLHTRNAFVVPAVAVALGLLLTDREPDLVRGFRPEVGLGQSWGYKYPHASVTQMAAGGEFQLRRWLAVGVEADAVFPRDDFNEATGFAVRPWARFYPVTRKGWRLYFESGGGLIRFDRHFPAPTDRDPRRGTRWNGLTKYGVGGAVRVGPTIELRIAARHVHVSNGNAEGEARNPSHDSNGIFVGLSWQPSGRPRS